MLSIVFVGTGLALAETPTTDDVSSASAAHVTAQTKPHKPAKKHKTSKPATTKKAKPAAKSKIGKTEQTTPPVQQ